MDPRVGVLVITVVMLAAAGVMWATAVPAPDRPLFRPEVPWWTLVPAFALAEAVALQLQIRREAQTVSVNELPLAVALLLCSPWGLLAAVVLGSGFVWVVVRRQSVIKATFNLSLRVFGCTAMIVLVHAGLGEDPALGPRAWLVCLGALIVGGAIDGLCVLLAISLHESSVGPRDILHELVRYPLVTPLVGCIGLIAVTTIHADPRAAALLVVLGAGLMAAYRAHASLSDRHVSLTGLYDLGRSVTQAHDLEEIVDSVLRGARDMLWAECAELVLLASRPGEADRRWVMEAAGTVIEVKVRPGDPARWESVLAGRQPAFVPRRHGRELLADLGYREVIVVPMLEESDVIGTLLVADRLGEVRPFRPADVRSLETVAHQAGLALRNGRLLDRLRHDAFHDALTGLANRTLFRQTVDAELHRVFRGSSRGCAVMLVDLDGFKEVNDSLGHHAGDTLLVHVANRLRGATGGAPCTVARLGGDEFALLLAGCDDERRALAAANDLLHALAQPLVLDGVDVTVRASVGVALSSDGARDTASLLRRADAAMYQAKIGGGGTRLHDGTQAGALGHTRLEYLAELRRAIGDGDIVVFVQPQATTGTREVVGAEALVRWRHPRYGLLNPEQFLPVAERHGLIPDITEIVLDRAVEAGAHWAGQGLPLRVSVNVTPRTLLDRRTRALVEAALDRYGLPPGRLTLEITEEAVMTDPDRAATVLREYRAFGVRISLDDFGTGYSSLSYLGRLPADELKIDASFVAALGNDPEGLVIVRSIIDLGRNLALEVVAEGVEDEATWGQLRTLGADAVQGYRLARPMPIAEFVVWHRSRGAEAVVAIPQQGGQRAGSPPGDLLTPAGDLLSRAERSATRP
jgi:diguanylate cyclase (GGDEF)-like protein